MGQDKAGIGNSGTVKLGGFSDAHPARGTLSGCVDLATKVLADVRPGVVTTTRWSKPMTTNAVNTNIENHPGETGRRDSIVPLATKPPLFNEGSMDATTKGQVQCRSSMGCNSEAPGLPGASAMHCRRGISFASYGSPMALLQTWFVTGCP